MVAEDRVSKCGVFNFRIYGNIRTILGGPGGLVQPSVKARPIYSGHN